MRFSCPHCGYQNSRPMVGNGRMWVDDTDPYIHGGSTWCCSECHKPVVIEPQTPEERRDKFVAHMEWLRNNTKMEVVELPPPRCKQCGGVVEEKRWCYATPVCFACLPPPEPMKMEAR